MKRKSGEEVEVEGEEEEEESEEEKEENRRERTRTPVRQERVEKLERVLDACARVMAKFVQPQFWS